MLKKIARRLKAHIMLPIAEFMIKHKKFDFNSYYNFIRVCGEDYLKGVDFSDVVKCLNADIYEFKLLKRYPECYKFAIKATLLAWKFYNT